MHGLPKGTTAYPSIVQTRRKGPGLLAGFAEALGVPCPVKPQPSKVLSTRLVLAHPGQSDTCKAGELAGGVVPEEAPLETLEEHDGPFFEASVVDLALHHLRLELHQVVLEAFVTLQAAPEARGPPGQARQQPQPQHG